MTAFETEVVINERIAEGICIIGFAISAEMQKAFVPGQFAHINIPNAPQLVLRRPLSINSMHHGRMTLVYQIKGEGTKALTRAVTGTPISVLAPLGNGFKLPEEAKTVWIVGGGVGITPMQAIVETYKNKEFRAFLGYRSDKHVYCYDNIKKHCKDTVLCTDDGSQGLQMTSVAAMELALKDIKPDIVIACGPKPMLRALKKVSTEHDLNCLVSLEERMGCGIGVCRTCVCKIKKADKWDYERVCLDGPVYDINEVMLDG